MRMLLRLALPFVVSVLATHPANAASAEVEQAFLDAYKAAFAAQDVDAFAALMQTDGAIEAAVDYYLLNLSVGFGGEVSLTLEDLTAEELVEISGPLPGLDGQDYVLTPTPYKRLIIDVAGPDGEVGGGAVFVADLGDRIVISTPAHLD